MKDLTKMILMLSSDNPHEVFSAAQAIGRALKKEGHDWHWFAAQFGPNTAAARYMGIGRKEREASTLDNLGKVSYLYTNLQYLHGEKHVKFVRDLHARFMQGMMGLTPAQQKYMHDLFNKVRDYKREKV